MLPPRTSFAPPGVGWKLVARQQISSPDLARACGCDGNVVPRGREVPLAALSECRNSRVLLDSGIIQWMPPTPPPVARPPVVARSEPAVAVVVEDHVVAWDLLVAAKMRERNTDCRSVGVDMALASPGGADAWRLCLLADAEKQRGSFRRVPRRP